MRLVVFISVCAVVIQNSHKSEVCLAADALLVNVALLEAIINS